jgi:hypothetical protein
VFFLRYTSRSLGWRGKYGASPSDQPRLKKNDALHEDQVCEKKWVKDAKTRKHILNMARAKAYFPVSTHVRASKRSNLDIALRQRKRNWTTGTSHPAQNRICAKPSAPNLKPEGAPDPTDTTQNRSRIAFALLATGTPARADRDHRRIFRTPCVCGRRNKTPWILPIIMLRNLQEFHRHRCRGDSNVGATEMQDSGPGHGQIPRW